MALRVAGAPAGSAVVLNRKAAPTKQEVVPTDKYPFAALQKALEQGPGTEISSEIGSAAASVGLGVKVPPGLGAVEGCGAVGDGARGRCSLGEAHE